MTTCNAANVRQFILKLYADRITANGHKPETIKDDFDLMTHQIIDSLGVLELVSAIENEFNIIVDLEGLDAEQLTVIGPLSEYIGRTAQPKAAA